MKLWGLVMFGLMCCWPPLVELKDPKTKTKPAGKINTVPLKVPPDVLKEILEEESLAMEMGSTMQENIDVTMGDLAREQQRMNPRARRPVEDGTRKILKPGSAKNEGNAQEVKESAKKVQNKEMPKKTSNEKRSPNVVIILADDLGYGDIGCHGNTTLRTQGVDRICNSGARLTHHLTAEATCTPSRAALLTGRLPKRIGIATTGLWPVFINMGMKSGLPSNETTFAKILQQRGYKTALIGKWHLGLNCETSSDGCHHPNNHGFDYFFGLPLSNFRNLGENGGDMVWVLQPHIFPSLIAISLAGFLSIVYLRKYLGGIAYLLGLGCFLYSTYQYLFISNIVTLNGVLMRQKEVVEQPIRFTRLPERFTMEGEQFLEERKTDGSPFLLFMSWDQVHTHMHTSDRFKGKSAHGSYGDNVEEMAWCTGRILEKLEELGLSDNTLVYFSSDNGGHHEEFNEVTQEVEGGHNGIFSGGKVMGGQEGGIRVPSAISWPGYIPAGVSIDVPTSQMDILPTLLEILDVAPPTDRVLDGKSILPLLQGEESKSPHNIMFHYCNHWLHSARYIPEKGDAVYKLHWYWPDWLPETERCEGFACGCLNNHHKLTSPRLYDVTSDPGEHHALDVTLPGNAEVVARILELRREHEEGLAPVPDQFAFFTNAYRPWLQPCCNFPSCSCTDPKDPFS